MAENMTGLQCP